MNWLKQSSRPRRQRAERMQQTISEHRGFLDQVYQSGYRDCDDDLFRLLWCELAEIAGVAPNKLREQDSLVHRFPGPKSWWSMQSKRDDLDYLVALESRNSRLPNPVHPLGTVGDVLGYLLGR